MQSSHAALPVLGFGGVVPCDPGGHMGPPLGQASTGMGHVGFVVA
jgi:hypothetical protein